MGSRPERSYYTLAEAADALGVHYETAARWVRSGKLPGVKLSRRKVIVPKEKCDALMSGTLHEAKKGPWWRPLIGTLTPQEAEGLRAVVEECCEKVDQEEGT